MYPDGRGGGEEPGVEGGETVIRIYLMKKKNLMFNLEEKERNKHFRLGIALFPVPRRQRPA